MNLSEYEYQKEGEILARGAVGKKMKELNLEIISVAVVVFILSLSEFLNIRSYGYKEIEQLKSRIEKFEKISEPFIYANSTSSDFELIQNLNTLRNNIFWNSDKSLGYCRGDIQYPMIVNSDGKNIENQKNVIRPLNFSGGMIVISSETQIILAFSIQPSRNYLLIPLMLNDPTKVYQTHVQSSGILDKYDFSIKFGFHQLRLDFLLQLIFWVAVVLGGVILVRRAIEYRENEFMEKIKINERKFFKSRDSLEKTHSALLNQAFSYVNRYQFLSKALTDIPIPQKIPKDKKQLSIIGIFSGKINLLEDIINKVLTIFDESLKNYRLEIIQEHKGRGNIFCDEDLLFSLMLIVLANVLKSSPCPQKIKVSSTLKEGELSIDITGKFSEGVKGVKYPPFLRISISKNKDMMVKRIFVPSLVFKENNSEIGVLSGDNVVSLFSN